MKFETALKQLEQIVEDLENGELELDSSLTKFEEGVKLTKFCSNHLNEAEKKIELLTRDSNGLLKTTQFKPQEEEPNNSD